MQQRYLVINWLLFIIFTTILGFSIKFQITNFSLFINENTASVLFCICFPLKIYGVKVWRYVILVALLILLFSPLSCSYTTIEGDIPTIHSEAKFNSLVSPLTFFILLLFLAFNCNAMIDLYHLISRGSEREQKEELSKEIEFYYNKFNVCSNTELFDIFKMYNDYPAGAQLALNRIKKEKGID